MTISESSININTYIPIILSLYKYITHKKCCIIFMLMKINKMNLKL